MATIFEGQVPDIGDDQPWPRLCAPEEVRPFECKTLYVAGLIRHLVEAMGYALGGNFQTAAVALVVSTFEVHGMMSDASIPTLSSARLLRTGLRIAAGVPDEEEDPVVLEIRGTVYTVEDCVSLRNFTAHGAKHTGKPVLMLPELPGRLAELSLRRLNRWWAQISAGDEDARANLVEAQVVPITVGSRAVFVGDMVTVVAPEGATPGGTVLHEDQWRQRR